MGPVIHQTLQDSQGADFGISSELQKRTLLATPSRMPANRLALATREKETEEQDSEYFKPESSADESSLSLIMVSNVGEGEDIRQTDDESMDLETFPTLIPLSHAHRMGDTDGDLP